MVTDLPVRIDAVLLDLFDTLIRVDDGLLPLLKVGDGTIRSTVPAVLRELRAVVPGLADEEVVRAMIGVLREPPPRAGHEEIPEHAVFASVLERLDVRDEGDRLAYRLADAQMAAVVAAARPLPGARALLAALRERGVRTALVSNLSHAASLGGLLSVADPTHRFDATVISIEVGYCKPDVRPFACALESLRVEAAHTIHIGDRPVDDVAGAANAGIHPVWLNPSGDPWPCSAGSSPTTVSCLIEAEAILRVEGSMAV